ncbi:hypothetical protein VTK56DRAFT_4435 [Thermocarpiscus australiensis]
MPGLEGNGAEKMTSASWSCVLAGASARWLWAPYLVPIRVTDCTLAWGLHSSSEAGSLVRSNIPRLPRPGFPAAHPIMHPKKILPHRGSWPWTNAVHFSCGNVDARPWQLLLPGQLCRPTPAFDNEEWTSENAGTASTEIGAALNKVLCTAFFEKGKGPTTSGYGKPTAAPATRRFLPVRHKLAEVQWRTYRLILYTLRYLVPL